MVRFLIVVITCVFLMAYYVPKMTYYARHAEHYDEEACYRMAQVMIEHVKRHGRIRTVADGMDTLPKEGGYIMYANHQGKYDALGVIGAHEKPCTFVMDDARSHLFIVTQFCDLLKAKRLKRGDLKQQIRIISEVATEIRAGRRYILFPEGGYDHNHNSLRKFMSGSFKIAQRAKCPIVPVVLYDSFKPFEGRSFRRVVTQVHFLPPIPYETFAHMKSAEIRDMVVAQIQAELDTMKTRNDF